MKTLYLFLLLSIFALFFGCKKDEPSILRKPPLCVTQPAIILSYSAATLNGTVNANNIITIVSFEFGTTTNYGTIVKAYQSLAMGDTITHISADTTDLAPNTTYHFRIKAENSLGVVYGVDEEFTIHAPTVTTLEITNLTDTSAVTGGNIIDNGTVITDRGIYLAPASVWDCHCRMIPHMQYGSGTGSFTANLTGLRPSTSYRVRSYACTSDGFCVYGSIISFTTLP